MHCRDFLRNSLRIWRRVEHVTKRTSAPVEAGKDARSMCDTSFRTVGRVL